MVHRTDAALLSRELCPVNHGLLLSVASVLIFLFHPLDKLGLEFFNGSISALATDRFNSVNTFTKVSQLLAMFFYDLRG